MIRIYINEDSSSEVEIEKKLQRLGHKKKRVLMKLLEKFFAAYPGVSPDTAMELIDIYGIPAQSKAPVALDANTPSVPEKRKKKASKTAVKASASASNVEHKDIPAVQEKPVIEVQDDLDGGNEQINSILSGLLALQS